VAEINSLCVFCGSSSGAKPEYVAASHVLADVMAEQGISLVYGGAHVGIMGQVADRLLQAGGKVYGVIPESLVDMEVAHDGLTELHVVNSMHTRKAKMAELSDAFVSLPGGLGTLEEMFEVLTWAQLGFHEKPCGILNVAGFYDQLLSFLDNATEQQFMHESHRQLLMADTDPTALLKKLLAFEPERKSKLELLQTLVRP
jgi:uncharacterized protein (TIGR00730 family)